MSAAEPPPQPPGPDSGATTTRAVDAATPAALLPVGAVLTVARDAPHDGETILTADPWGADDPFVSCDPDGRPTAPARRSGR